MSTRRLAPHPPRARALCGRASLALAAILLAGLAAAPAAPAVVEGDVLASSTFDTDADGWTAHATLTRHASGGNPGGYITSTPESFHPAIFRSPAKFKGDKSAAAGGQLSFDYLADAQTASEDKVGVELHGVNLHLEAEFYVALAEGVWTPVALSLVPANFRCLSRDCGGTPTQAEFEAVLNDLDSLSIRAVAPGGTDGLDNVALKAGPNDAPSAANDRYSTHAALSVPAESGVLANDTDPDDDPLSATLLSAPDHGTLELNANGSFIYTPRTGYVGQDSFTYSASDNIASSSAATVTIDVTNTKPDCSAVTASPSTLPLPTTRDQFETITLTGATDADGDALAFHITLVSQDEPVTGLGDDTSPDAQFVGSADSNQVRVRAERNPKGNGRVYRIAYAVTDGYDEGFCLGVETVSVLRKEKTEIGDGNDFESWDSFTGAELTP